MVGRESGIKNGLRSVLQKAGSNGIWQFELDHLLGFAKSYVSDTLKIMEKGGEIIRFREGEKVVRIWLTEYYPFPVRNLIRIWMLKASEYVPMMYSLYETSLKTGYRVIIHTGISGDEINQALIGGYADVGFLPSLTSMISCYSSGKIRILAGIASGGSAILENVKATGRRVAATNASSMYALANLFFSGEDKKFAIFENQEDAADRFSHGEIRYLVIWEPYLSRLLSNTDVVKVSDYEDLLDSIPCCTLCTNKEYLKSNSEILMKSVSLYNKIIQEEIKRILEDRTFSKELMKIFTGFSMEELKESMKSLKLYDGDLLSSYGKLRNLLNVPIAEETILNCLG